MWDNKRLALAPVYNTHNIDFDGIESAPQKWMIQQDFPLITKRLMECG
ncbi:MAG: hypothetical protein M3352_07335 [Bacteroidota bacterium]|nr:hypothetical protein [Bacteroidota bacterium]